jgi:hypothetical protein
MTILFVLLGVSAAMELAVHGSGKHTKIRTLLAVLTLLADAFTIGILLASSLGIFSIIVALLMLYRICNMIRVVERRMHEAYLKRATRTTTYTIMGLQVLALASWWAWDTWHTTGHTAWTVLAAVQATIALLFFIGTVRTMHRTAWPARHRNFSDKELPTVTVAIPVRDEIDDLQQCLESIIASDYPKLEILALDDRSQTRRTPEIIRAFAHDGVRFLQGREPAETWLPKNQAYDQLADEASGQYILFCGADVRLAPHSIRDMVATMLERNKDMLCVLPQRDHNVYGRFSVIQAMRYWWELVPPRRLFHRPPVQSACWVITAKALKQAGGFASVSRAIVPEAHFARRLVAIDSYSFLRSNIALGVQSTKNIADQRQTAIRMRYPQLHRRPEQVAIVTFAEAFLLVMPYILSIGGFWWSIGQAAHILTSAACLFITLAYVIVTRSTRVHVWWFTFIGQPVAAMADIALLHYSLWKYEFSTVEWKGRNVTGPVMHVIPHLPKVD